MGRLRLRRAPLTIARMIDVAVLSFAGGVAVGLTALIVYVRSQRLLTDRLLATVERYREAGHHLPTAFMIRSRDGELLYHNAKCEALLGQPGQGGAAQDLGQALFERARQSGLQQTESLSLVQGDQPHVFQITATPLPDGAIVCAALDQSQITALQADLARHVSAHSDVLEALSTAIAIYGPDRRLRFANAAFASLWDLPPEWLNDQPSFGEVLEKLREKRRLPEVSDFPAFRREQLALFLSLVDQREELLHLPNGATLRMLVTPHPLGGLIFTYEDVTDRLALESSYNTLIEVQRETLDSLSEGVAVFGLDGRLKLWNPVYLHMWGLSEEWAQAQPTLREALSRAGRYFPAIADWSVEVNRILKEVSQRKPRHGIDARGDGSFLEFTSVPMPDGSILFIFVDVTDRRRVEMALREKNEALEAADRLKTEFIANVSYELRTPLNTIIGFAEILANQYFGELNPRQLDYSRGIYESSQRLLQLINDILDLATIEAGYMELSLEDVDLYMLLVTTLGPVRERARSQQLTVDFDVDRGLGTIMADQKRLRQALFNLMSNACKFTPPGGRIRITASRSVNHVDITIADTGIGIPDHDQQRVFERFERRGRHAGAGLGLSLVKSFIELHGGSVMLTSAKGEGTSVTCRLPLHPGSSGLGSALPGNGDSPSRSISDASAR